MLGWKVTDHIGPLAISPHGVGIAIGVLVGAWVMARRARAQGLDEDYTWNGAAIGVVGAIIGARVAYVVGHLDRFDSPVEWLYIWQGGISLVGGLIGAFTFVAIYAKRSGFSFFSLVDLGAPGLGIGIAVGRIGDLVVGDHLGKQTDFFLGWEYQGGFLISAPPCVTPTGERVYSTIDGCIEVGTVVHQTALYDMIWSLVIFAIILQLEKSSRGRGLLFLSWAGLYAAGRIFTDFLRVDKTWLGLGLTGSQLTSIVVLVVVGVLLARYKGAPPSDAPGLPAAKEPEPEPSFEPEPSSEPEPSQQTEPSLREDDLPPAPPPPAVERPTSDPKSQDPGSE